MVTSDTPNLVQRNKPKVQSKETQNERVETKNDESETAATKSDSKERQKSLFKSSVIIVVNGCFLVWCLLSISNKETTTEEGGWSTSNRDRLPSGPCNIPRINARTVSQGEFLRRYAHHTPVVIEGGDVNSDFRTMCERQNLLDAWGHATVRLSSANTYSYGTKDVPLKQYIETMIQPQNIRTLANETFYFFGYNDMDEWKDFFDAYRLPPYELPGHTHALSFGLAGPGSGVPFHFHGPGFAETLHGRKRWFLTPHHVQPEFNPNKTTLKWLTEDYERIAKEVDLHECTIRPGEIIYFPDRWWHATLNLDTAVFISTFLSP